MTTVTRTQHLCYWLASCTTQSNIPVYNQHSSFNFIVVELAVSLASERDTLRSVQLRIADIYIYIIYIYIVRANFVFITRKKGGA